MGRSVPEELWRRHTLERFIALKQSGELDRLRRKGLTICGRKKRFTGKEWFKSFHKRYSSSEYREWVNECEAIGQKFGLASWTVVCACLVSGYDPEKEPFPVEVQWPKIRVVTEQSDPLFLHWLSYKAHRLGLYVVQRQGSVETTLVPLNFPPSSPLPVGQRPPPDCTFYMRVEVPPGYPPQAGKKLLKDAKRREKELLRRLGYSVSERLRSSSLVSMADELKPMEALPKRGLYELVTELWPDDEGSTVDVDEARRKLVKSRRHKLRKRLVEKYEPDT